MKKQEKEKILKSFSQPQIEALGELFQEELDMLNSVETINTFEETLGRKIAIQVLKDIMRRLRILKEKEIEKSKNEYL